MPEALPLPTFDDALQAIIALLPLCPEVAPRAPLSAKGLRIGIPLVPALLRELHSCVANEDEDLDMRGIAPADAAYLLRQIEYSRSAYRARGLGQPSPWLLPGPIAGLALADWSIQDAPRPFRLLALELPLFSCDRTRVILRGQCCEHYGAEDFEHRFALRAGAWERRS